MHNRHLLVAAPMPKVKQLPLHVKLVVSDVKNVKKHVQMVLLLLPISVHILITVSVQTVVHVKKHAREVSSSDHHKYLKPRYWLSQTGVFSRIDVCFFAVSMI